MGISSAAHLLYNLSEAGGAEELFAPDAIDYFVMILGYANVIHGVVASITFSSIYYMYTYCSCCFHFCWTAAVATIATKKVSFDTQHKYGYKCVLLLIRKSRA